MRRALVIALPVLLVGFALGNAFWYVASPFWIDRVVDEPLPAELMPRKLASGAFRDVDSLHKGRGTATLYATAGGATLLRLTEFAVTNGPKLEVWLSAATDPASSAEVRNADRLSLGPLKGNVGDQTYYLPDDIDLDRFRSVVVWCVQFGVLFSPAALTTPS